MGLTILQVKRAAVGLAIFSIYALDFAVNVVQATSRSLIVDVLPLSEQQLGSAWAGRMLGLGTLLGYSVGTLDLKRQFGGIISASQFQQICIIASSTLMFCVATTCYFVKERNLLPADYVKKSTFQHLSDIFTTAFRLPKKVQLLCWITFWTWIAWSPFHVYGSTWVGEIYFQQDATTREQLKDSTDVAGDLARKGSQALVFFSLTSFAGSVILPWIVLPRRQYDGSAYIRVKKNGDELRPTGLRACQPDITTAWGISQLMLTASLALAPFVKSFWSASISVASCGM